MIERTEETPFTEMTDGEVFRRMLRQQFYQSQRLEAIDKELREIKGHTGCLYIYLIISVIVGTIVAGLSILRMLSSF